MWLRLPAMALAALALGLLLGSGPGTRAELWPYQTGFLLLRAAAYAGVAAAVLALLALTTRSLRGTWAGGLLAALAIGLACAFVPWQYQQRARSAPPIHDISTDLEQPPAFHALLAVRNQAPNGAAHGGKAVADQQRAAYPDIQPLLVAAPVSVVFVRARDTAEAMGWKVAGTDAAAGRIEATTSTFWFGFKDDVVIRVTPTARGSRVDMRSVSRVGRGDAGANAARIRDYLRRLRG